MSPAAKAKISAAQKARWAKTKGEQLPEVKPAIVATAVKAASPVKSQRMYVWFSGPGKKVKQIKKIAPGKYAWVD